MRKLTRKEVKQIANLARLKLKKKGLAKFQKQLSETLTYVKILANLKTKKVAPTAQVTGLKNIWRQDKISSSLTAKEALSGAKEKHQQYFKIKAVF